MGADVTGSEAGFWQTIDLFGRSTRAANFLLDYWWLWLIALFGYWLYRRVQSEHALLGQLDERCAAAFADIDSVLAQRHALILNLVEAVKGFATQEHKVLQDVMEARAKAMANVGATRNEAEAQIGQSVNSLFAISESYPELASSSHFHELRNEMTRIEDRITAARRFYNLTVEELYGVSRAFPGNLLAGIARIGVHEKFTLGEQRAQMAQPVQISFSA